MVAIPYRSRAGGIDFRSQELLELSIVPIPANADCLLAGISGGGEEWHVADCRWLNLTAPQAKALRRCLLKALPSVARAAADALNNVSRLVFHVDPRRVAQFSYAELHVLGVKRTWR
jgi:hypothetical protein